MGLCRECQSGGSSNVARAGVVVNGLGMAVALAVFGSFYFTCCGVDAGVVDNRLGMAVASAVFGVFYFACHGVGDSFSGDSLFNLLL